MSEISACVCLFVCVSMRYLKNLSVDHFFRGLGQGRVDLFCNQKQSDLNRQWETFPPLSDKKDNYTNAVDVFMAP